MPSKYPRLLQPAAIQHISLSNKVSNTMENSIAFILAATIIAITAILAASLVAFQALRKPPRPKAAEPEYTGKDPGPTAPVPGISDQSVSNIEEYLRGEGLDGEALRDAMSQVKDNFGGSPKAYKDYNV